MHAPIDRRIASHVGFIVALLTTPALATERTTLTFESFAPTEPRYSQAGSVSMKLARPDTTAVAGTECSPACSVILFIAPSADLTASCIVNPQGFVTDTGGVAQARIAFVDGRFDDCAFLADGEGAPYTLTARFLGAGAGQVPTNPDCADGAPGTVGGGFCPSEATFEIDLFLETAEIVLGAGLEAALGDTLTLSAELQDPNGDVATGGTLTDGEGAKDLTDVTVTFFYDVNNNGRPDAAETLGTAVTNSAGVASRDFFLDPNFVRAGTYDNGIHAEFGGNGLYGVARAAAALLVRPADVDVERTVLEVDPPEIPADGFSKTTVRVRLVDSFNNPLDNTSDDHSVVLTSDLGLLVDAVARDPLSGTYTQVLQAQRKTGTATITATIDDVIGPSITVELTGESGCHCAGVTSTAPLLLAGVAFLKRRRA